MSTKEGLGYSVGKIWITLLVLTAIEVAWAMPPFIREHRGMLWSGLLLCALVKGGLIFMYFMHMRFERWLVWSLIVPTPLLIVVIFGYVSPDLSFNAQRDYPNGMMRDSQGRVVSVKERIHAAHGHAAGDAPPSPSPAGDAGGH